MNGIIENFDSASTTPVDERVLKFIIPYFTDRYGNSSSVYGMGRKSNKAINEAKIKISEVLNCPENGVFFTSGGTESNNWILNGFPYESKNVIVSETEHSSVLIPAEMLNSKGVISLTKIGVKTNGVIDLSVLECLLKEKPIDLVSVQTVNNETGIIQPISDIYSLCKKYGTSLHTDATQAFGKMNLSLNSDYMTISAHKTYAPKGVGALIVNSGAKTISPFVLGGHQQSGMRAGSLPVPLIVGLGKTCEYLGEWVSSVEGFRNDMKGLRSIFQQYGIKINNDENVSLPSFLNISIECDSSLVIAMMENDYGMVLSKGSACLEGKPSYVLKAMGRTDLECKNCIRISLSKFNKRDKFLSLPHMIKNCMNRIQKEE